MKDAKFREYYSKLAREGLIKSAIIAVLVGFLVNFVSALAIYVFQAYMFWMAIVLGVLTMLVVFPACYQKFFKPTSKSVSARVDRLGLEERIITMQELEDSKEFIALKQREDAESKLKQVSASQLKMAIFKVPTIVALIVVILGSSMTTVTALSENGVFPTVEDLRDKLNPNLYDTYTVLYTVDDPAMGQIVGLSIQELVYGQVGEAVIAYPAEGYVFSKWSDEYVNPVRADIGFQDVNVVAYFVQAGEGSGDGQQPPDGGEPGEPNPGTGTPSQSGDSSDSNNDNSGASGKYENNDQIVNGEDDYREFIESYIQLLENAIATDESLTEEEIAFIRAYIDSISQNQQTKD